MTHTIAKVINTQIKKTLPLLSKIKNIGNCPIFLHTVKQRVPRTDSRIINVISHELPKKEGFCEFNDHAALYRNSTNNKSGDSECFIKVKPATQKTHHVEQSIKSRARSNKDIAIDVFNKVMSAYKRGLGSSNKILVNESENDDERVNSARETLIKLQSISANKNEAQEKSSDILRIDAANCTHLATVVVREANKLGCPASVWGIKTNIGAGYRLTPHNFAVIGTPQDNSSYDFKNFDQVWIVDPWLGVVCEAPEYIESALDKMAEQQKKGIAYVNIRENRRLENPIGVKWLNILCKGEKVLEFKADSDRVKFHVSHLGG